MKFEMYKVITPDDIGEAKQGIGKLFYFANAVWELRQAVEGEANYKPHKLILFETGRDKPFVCYWEQEKQMLNYAYVYPYEVENEIINEGAKGNENQRT